MSGEKLLQRGGGNTMCHQINTPLAQCLTTKREKFIVCQLAPYQFGNFLEIYSLGRVLHRSPGAIVNDDGGGDGVTQRGGLARHTPDHTHTA